MLVKVDKYPCSHSCITKINEPDVLCGNTLALVSSFGSASSWILPSCVDFNTVTFGS